METEVCYTGLELMEPSLIVHSLIVMEVMVVLSTGRETMEK